MYIHAITTINYRAQVYFRYQTFINLPVGEGLDCGIAMVSDCEYINIELVMVYCSWLVLLAHGVFPHSSSLPPWHIPQVCSGVLSEHGSLPSAAQSGAPVQSTREEKQYRVGKIVFVFTVAAVHSVIVRKAGTQSSDMMTTACLTCT